MIKTSEEITPCVRELFKAEESHYHIFFEQCLPNESEISVLRELTLFNTQSSEWPEDSSFDNELNDRLANNFREAIIVKLSTSALLLKQRSIFLEESGKEIALSTFTQVKNEYQNKENETYYWGDSVGYFT